MRRCVIHFMLLVLFLLSGDRGKGQDYLFNVRHLSVEDGLLGRQIYSINQDAQGFIWIGTWEGLNRFDGHRFQHFSNQKLRIAGARNLHLDAQNRLWLRTDMPNTIRLLDTRTFACQTLQEAISTELPQSVQHTYRISKIDEHISLETGSSIFTFRNQTFQALPSKNLISFSSYGEWRAQATPDGFYRYFGQFDSPLPQLDFPGFSITELAEISPHFSVLVLKKTGSARRYLARMPPDGKSMTIIDSTRSQNIILQNKLLFFNNKIYIPHEGQLLSHDISEHLKADVATLFRDQQNNIWIGTENGIVLVNYKPRLFQVYFDNAKKNGDNYMARGIWANQRFLYACSNDGNYRWDFHQQRSTSLYADYPYALNFIQKVRTGELVIGGDAPFLLKVDPATAAIMDRIPVQNTNHFFDLHQDTTSRYWMGMLRGIHYVEADTLRPYDRLNGHQKLMTISVYQVEPVRQHNELLWLATQAGLYLLHPEKGVQRRYWVGADTVAFRLPVEAVHDIYQDADGICWMTTVSGGLLRVEFDEHLRIVQAELISTEAGMPTAFTYHLRADRHSYLWISSREGIIRFNKSTRAIQVFSTSSGIPFPGFNWSSFERADGQLFFGSGNGIVSFHPDDFLNDKPYAVPLRISVCQKFSEAEEALVDITPQVLEDSTITLQPNDRFFTLQLSLQDYFHAPKLEYYYKIDGFQQDFTLAQNNTISVSGLPYGKYNLHLKAKGPDKRFSTQELHIPVLIKRPFYWQAWFIITLIAVVILAIWQLFAWRLRSLQNRKLELEQIVQQRTTLLRQQTRHLKQDKKTIEQQAQKLRSLDEMKSRFFANISHELRTPLTLILGPANKLLKNKATDEPEQTYARIIQQNAYSLLRRINEILDLIKLEAREMQLQPEPTHFYTFAQRLAATFDSMAQQKNQTLTLRYQLDKKLQILLDQDKFEHIFNNFLSNAVKYTHPGGKITVRLREASQPGHHLLLEVQDEGPGIHPDDLPHVFERFYQARHTQNKSGSSGIGLALSKEITQVMHGSIWAESQPGQGSTFFFAMPYEEYFGVIEPEEHQEQAREAVFLPTLQSPIQTDRPTVLLVEDNLQLRNYIHFILQEHYNVITAEHGADAVQQLTLPSQQPRVDLIVSDIMMPVMDGFELLQKLKTSDQWRHLPVVMLTARSSVSDRLQALRIGVDDYLLKPFLDEELLARISNLLKNAANRQLAAAPAFSPNAPTALPKDASLSAADLDWLRQVEEILQAELDNPNFKINELANQLYISQRQMNRRIKKITGLTPNQYFREIKLQAARHLLENQEVQTVTELTHSLGFSTPAYFSKIYEERFGKRPTDYL